MHAFVPTLPAGHALQLALLPATTQPALPLQPPWPTVSCHVPFGQLLHDAWPPRSWCWPLGQLWHAFVPALPAGHALQPCLLDATTQPALLLHAPWPTVSCHEPFGQLLHDTPPSPPNLPLGHAWHSYRAPVPQWPLFGLLRHIFPLPQRAAPEAEASAAVQLLPQPPQPDHAQHGVVLQFWLCVCVPSPQ